MSGVNPTEQRAQLLRGSVMAGAWKFYPGGIFQSQMTYLLEAFDLEEDEADRELAYLEEAGYITRESMKIIGRRDNKIKLTPKGVRAARKMDAGNPLLVEGDDD